MNDGGASTLVRQELARRPQLLAGKTLVIWEFVERDIGYGTEGWQVLPAEPVQDRFEVAHEGLAREQMILCPLIWLCVWCVLPRRAEPPPEEELRLSVSWGHRSPPRFVLRGPSCWSGWGLDSASWGQLRWEKASEGAWRVRAGGGDVDGVAMTLRFPHRDITERKPLHPIWSDLVAQSDPDTARRLRLDPGFRPDPRS